MRRGLRDGAGPRRADTRERASHARSQRVPAAGPRDRERLHPARRRPAPRGPALAPGGCGVRPGPRRHRVHAVPQARPPAPARQPHPPLPRRARVRVPAGRRAGVGGLRRPPSRRVGGRRARRRGRDDRVGRAPALVLGSGRHAREVVERLHLPHPRGAGAGPPQGDRPRLLRRRPLPPVPSLDRGRVPPRAALVDGHDGALQRPPARPRHRRRGLATHVAGAPRRQRTLDRHLARPPAPRRLLAARLHLRGLERDPMPGLRGRRLGGLSLALGAGASSRTSTCPAGGSSVPGGTTIPTRRCRGRPSGSCRSACASSTGFSRTFRTATRRPRPTGCGCRTTGRRCPSTGSRPAGGWRRRGGRRRASASAGSRSTRGGWTSRRGRRPLRSSPPSCATVHRSTSASPRPTGCA